MLLCMLLCVSLLPAAAMAEDDEIVDNYSITVTGGTANCTSTSVGSTVTITANNAPEGQVFKGWTSNPAVNFNNSTEKVASFTMPETDISVMAIFETVPVTHSIIISNGTASHSSAVADTLVTVTANSVDDQVFKHWTATPAVTFTDEAATTTSFMMPNEDVAVTAVFESAPVTYSIAVSGGESSHSSAAANTEVTVTAANAPDGQVFKSWSSSPPVSFADVTSSLTTFTMPDEDVSVTATFEDVPTTLNVMSGGINLKSGNEADIDTDETQIEFTVTVTDGNPASLKASPGSTVTITAATSTGKIFDKWTSNDEVYFKDSSSATTNFIMPRGDVTVKANYKDAPTEHKITVTGGVASAEKATKNSEITVTAEIPSGKVFIQWTSTTEGVTFTAASANPTTFLMPDTDVTIAADFEDAGTKHNIKVTGGSANPASAAPGVNVTITAKEPEGSTFDSWSTTAADVIFKDPKAKSTSFTMPGGSTDIEITANFKETTYAVTISSTVNGEVSVDKTTAAEGETVKVTVEPDKDRNYIRDTLTVINDSTKEKITVKNDQFTMPASAVTVSATFKKIKIVKGDGGTAHYGSRYSFTLNTDFEKVKRVYVDGYPIDYYDAYGDKGVVTLTRSYIKSLSVGWHDIRIVTDQGTVSGSFRVSSSPKTGDESNVALYVTVGIISLAGVAGIAYYLLKKKKK